MIVNIKKGYEDKIMQIINNNPDSAVRIKPTVSQVVHQALDDMFENFFGKSDNKSEDDEDIFSKDGEY